MHPPPRPLGLPQGPRRNTRTREVSRSIPIAIGLAIGLVMITSSGAGLEANEVEKIHRSGAVGQFAPIEINSLPPHRPLELVVETALEPVVAEVPRKDSQPAKEKSIRVAMVSRKSAATSRPAMPPAKPAPSAKEFSVIKDKLAPGESLSRLLRARGVSAQVLRTIDQQIRPEFDFRKSRPGDGFSLTLDGDGELVRFRYRTAPDESIVLTRTNDDYLVTREVSPLQPRVIRMQGTVQSSLYMSIRGLGHDPALASAFADIFAWDIDFTRQLKVGDGYTILYEQLYREEDGDEVYVRPGRILAAQFKGSIGEHTAVYFEEFDGIGSYFRPDGETVEQEYLVAPLKFNRISSDYSSARNHPILKIVRPHHGIDYAARTGTPLWSIADGTVIFQGISGGFGNLVKIRHAGGYVSFYAHLSNFNPNLAVGQKVKQKQVIGYVGQTGLATGPHVCFRVTKFGKYVNPALLNHGRPVQRSVADAQWADFQIVRDQLLLGLRDGPTQEFAGNAL